MRKINFLFTLIIFLISSAFIKIYPQSSTSAQVFARVITVLTANEITQMNFGKFSPETQGGSVLITPEGSLSVTGTVAVTSGTHNPASFYITGENNATYSIILPEQPALLTNTNNSKTMEVRDWVSIPPQGPGMGLLAEGSQEVKVGATLIVKSMENNPVGIYTGTYTITFGYN